MSNYEERKMIRTLDNARIYDELIPLIKAIAVSGGGAEQILKKSEAAAALNLVESLASEKDDVKLKASIEILNRTQGKPVERTLNIYGDISRMNEKDVDNQILRSLEASGAAQLLEAASVTRKKLKQGRKPRKSDILGQEPDQTTAEGPFPRAEEEPPSGPQTEGTPS